MGFDVKDEFKVHAGNNISPDFRARVKQDFGPIFVRGEKAGGNHS